MNRLSILFAALLLAGCAPEESSTPSTKTALPEGVEFVEQVASQAGKTVIPYHKYTLSNGLTLILHEDHSDPLVHVDVTYHVGSAREEVGKSGFAHFFEHMMFQGSEHVADEQHFKLITEAGGTMNGTTNSDRTNYYQTVPANQLEKVLWLESDRMGYLLDAVTQEKFEVQRETVKNERGQRIDNRPYGRLYERVAAALYPDGHPYSWPVIGYMEDLNRVDVNDLKAFFLRWYGPNNATLTIGGDIDVEETLALVERYFGAIPRGPEVAKPEKAPASLQEDRYISMEDNVHLPLLYMSFPTVHIRHEDEAPLDVLSFILGSGKTSLLYKNLVKNQMAVQAQASHPCQELACTFNLLALPHPASGKSLADMETVIRATLDEFEERGVQDDDLTKAKAQMEAGFVFGLQSVSGKVSQLASNETFTGNPNYIEEDIARYNNVTKADVMRVYREYIKGNHAVIMSVVPNGQADMAAKKDTYTQAKRKGIDSVKLVKEEDLELRRAEPDFDRSVIPAAGANRPVDVPEMWRDEMANGIKVLGTQSTETPTTALLLKIPAGHYYTSPQKAGMASLLAQMLSESTSKRSAEEMTKALEMLGSRVSVYADNHYINVSINTLSKHLDATMDLVAEKLFEPAFLPDEFERRRSNAIQSIKNNKKDASYLASTAYRQLLHDDNIAALPAKAQLIVVSELDQKALEPHLTSLAKWEGKGPELAIELPVPAVETGTIYLVNKEGAAQSAIRIGKRSLTYDVTGEFYKAYLMNFPLGGAFNSRINLNLREDKGYTYGARSFFDGDLLSGNYTASAEVRADVTDKSIVEFMEEIRNYADKGITAEELAFMRNAINQKDALRYETPRAKLGFLAKILEYDLDPNFVEKRTEIVKSISADEINSLAKKHLNPDDMIMVVVGDAETLKPQLEALGYKVVNYDV